MTNKIDFGLVLFQLGQTILVIIFCGLAFNGILPTIEKLNKYLNNHYITKKQRLQDKLEIEELKIHISEIEKVEPKNEQSYIPTRVQKSTHKRS